MHATCIRVTPARFYGRLDSVAQLATVVPSLLPEGCSGEMQAGKCLCETAEIAMVILQQWNEHLGSEGRVMQSRPLSLAVVACSLVLPFHNTTASYHIQVMAILHHKQTGTDQVRCSVVAQL